MNQYEVTEKSPILNQWREVGDVISMTPAQAQIYLQQKKVKAVMARPEQNK